MNLAEFIDPAFLGAQLWQVSALAFVVLVAVALFLRRSPHYAHALLLLVLVKAVCPPIWSSPTAVFGRDWQVGSPVTSSLPGDTPVGPPAASAPVTFEMRDTSDFVPSPDGNSSPPDSRPFPWASVLIGVWAIGAAVTGLLSVLRFWRESAALRNTLPPDDRLAKLFESTGTELGIRRRVRLLVSSNGSGPLSCGLFVPRVVIPQQLAATSCESNLRMVIAHELVHVARRDALVAVLQAVAGVLWWFHPLIWWVNRNLTRECEKCCDEEVIASIGCEPANYAQGILSVAKVQQKSLLPPLAHSIRAVDVTQSRLEAIMLQRRKRYTRTPWTCWILLVVGTALVVPGAPHASEAHQQSTPPAEEAKDDAPAERRVPQVSDEGHALAVQGLKDLGGRVRLFRERTDSKHWIQIILEGPTFDDDAMKLVRIISLDAPTNLHLRDTAVSPAGLARLQDARIRKLAVSGPNVTDETLRVLPNFEAMEDFSVASDEVTAEGFALLGRCPSLQTLSVPSSIGNAVLSEMTGLSKLSSLSLANPLDPATADHIDQLRGITSLSLTLADEDSNQVFQRLACLPALTRLTLRGEVAEQTLVQIGLQCGQLKELYVRRQKELTDAGVRGIAELPSLEVLALSGSSLSDTELQLLKPLQRLRWLDVNESNVSDLGLQVLTAFPSLRFLDLSQSDITDAGLGQLKQLEELTYLNVQGTYVKSIPAWLAERKKLRIFADVESPRSVDHDKAENRPDGLLADSALAKAVAAFNAKAAKNRIGKFQTPLTVQEVVASIRGWSRDRMPVDDETYAVFQEIADTGQMLSDAELTFTTGWRGFNGFHFDVWWVDLSVRKGGKFGFGYTYRLRDRKLSSRKLNQRELDELERLQ